MTLYEAIHRADVLRPNDIPEPQKVEWLYHLEASFAEMQGVDTPVNTWPDDSDLLVPAPYDQAYPMYLAAMIDYANQDNAQYANDMAMANTAITEYQAYYRRHNPTGLRYVRWW